MKTINVNIITVIKELERGQERVESITRRPELESEMGKTAEWLASDSVWFPLYLAGLINPDLLKDT